MLGFIIGTLCLIGLIATLRARRYGYGVGYGGYGGFHGRYAPPCDSRWERPWAHRPVSPRSVMREAFVRLDTTPGQEKAIIALIESGRDEVRGRRKELAEVRREIAALIASEALDRTELDARIAVAERVFARMGETFSRTLVGVHEVLDERQRRILSELLADGSFSHGSYYGC